MEAVVNLGTSPGHFCSNIEQHYLLSPIIEIVRYKMIPVVGLLLAEAYTSKTTVEYIPTCIYSSR